MSYMLDTNTCIYLMTDRTPQYQINILKHIEKLKLDQHLYLSSMVVFELSYGAQKGRWHKANMELLQEFLLDFIIQPFDEKAAHIAGEIRTALEKKGTPIGAMDTLIAAHAISLEVVLVTNNVGEFARVSGLKVENWVGS